MSTAPSDRKRTHPQDRFAASEEVIDLNTVADRLDHEEAYIATGHRQIALFKHGPMTAAMFTFEAGAELAGHVIDGPVMIQVLTGCVTIRTEAASHELPVGHLLRLAPGVRHDVQASEPSRLLLTICVEGPDSHA